MTSSPLPGVPLLAPLLTVDMGGHDTHFLLHAPHAAPQGLSGTVRTPAPMTPASLEKLLRETPAAAGLSPGSPLQWLVAAPETGVWDVTESATPPEHYASRHALFASTFTESAGPSLDGLLMDAPPEAFLRLRTIQRMTGGLVADVLGAAVLGVTADPVVLSRSWRQGILVLLAENDCLRAALVFQNRLFGIFERPWPEHIDILLRELESFRLGWLPPEAAAASGGWVATVPALPAEAEGFRPLYAAGVRAHLLQGHGQMADDPAMAVCRGLAHAFTSRQR